MGVLADNGGGIQGRGAGLAAISFSPTAAYYGGRIGPFCKYPFTPSKLGCFCRFASNCVCFSLIKPVASADSVHSSAASRLRARWRLQTRFKAPLLLAYKLSLYSSLAYFQTWLLLAYSARQACYYNYGGHRLSTRVPWALALSCELPLASSFWAACSMRFSYLMESLNPWT